MTENDPSSPPPISRIRILILWLLFVPFILASPYLLHREYGKWLGPAETRKMTKRQRQVHFLTRVNPGQLRPDLIELLDHAHTTFGNRKIRFAVISGSHVSEFSSGGEKSYSAYDLLPARIISDPKQADYVLYYQTTPPKNSDRLLASVKPENAPASFLVERTP